MKDWKNCKICKGTGLIGTVGYCECPEGDRWKEFEQGTRGDGTPDGEKDLLIPGDFIASKSVEKFIQDTKDADGDV